MLLRCSSTDVLTRESRTWLYWRRGDIVVGLKSVSNTFEVQLNLEVVLIPGAYVAQREKYLFISGSAIASWAHFQGGYPLNTG